MSHPSLWIAGLLTAGPLPAPPPPPLLPPEWWQQAIAALRAATAQPTEADAVNLANASNVINATISQPERAIEPLAVGAASALPVWRSPRSGAQLYQQRRAALAAGRLYTHLPPDSFASAWEPARTQPTHAQWQQLLQQEARAIARGQGDNRLSILLGDSLSQWFPTPLLPRGPFWLNQGISGENTQQVRQRLAALRGTRPSTLYVMAGINDLRQGASDATVLANLRAIARELHQQHPEAAIVLQSLLPTRWPNLSSDRIDRLNAAIRQIAREEGLVYLHLQPLFADADGQLRADLTTDGLHLNRQGYQVWQAALQATEQQLHPLPGAIAQR